MKFLVADPLAGVQTFARQLLQGHGFPATDILCCADTETALAQGLVFKPQFLITDWFAKAPLTGLQLHRHLRDAQPALQLALLSFDVTAAHEAEARTLGARFLLRKPFTAEQLKAAMTRALAAMSRPTSASARPALRRALPPMTPVKIVKPGDKVRFNGAVHVAQHVVIRNEGTVVQLKGLSDFVSLEKLQPA